MSNDNTVTIISANFLDSYKENETEGVLKLATDIGLEVIKLSKNNKNHPIRLKTFEETKGKKPRVVFTVEIDLDKPLKEDE